MQRNKSIAILIATISLVGCNHGPEAVTVDLDAVLKQDQMPAIAEQSLPQPPAPRPTLTETVPGAPAVNVPDPSNTPDLNVQDMFAAEQRSALEELQRR